MLDFNIKLIYIHNLFNLFNSQSKYVMICMTMTVKIKKHIEKHIKIIKQRIVIIKPIKAIMALWALWTVQVIVQATGNALTKAVTAAEAGGMVESLWKFGNFHKEISVWWVSDDLLWFFYMVAMVYLCFSAKSQRPAWVPGMVLFLGELLIRWRKDSLHSGWKTSQNDLWTARIPTTWMIARPFCCWNGWFSDFILAQGTSCGLESDSDSMPGTKRFHFWLEFGPSFGGLKS